MLNKRMVQFCEGDSQHVCQEATIAAIENEALEPQELLGMIETYKNTYPQIARTAYKYLPEDFRPEGLTMMMSSTKYSLLCFVADEAWAYPTVLLSLIDEHKNPQSPYFGILRQALNSLVVCALTDGYDKNQALRTALKIPMNYTSYFYDILFDQKYSFNIDALLKIIKDTSTNKKLVDLLP